ncbi:hypothetical protein Micbo1qcDRAFT_209092 [Microdochium bolleyi]|uniref:Uncharacterized protein n=1 Tax=Microdochium bolleyi TaxID=196109 RepID=A0A136INZ6_9PEZI|nr:hypothetical protein Micbo1qcDRAFT_209092 [Microdochium bolleyi]
MRSFVYLPALLAVVRAQGPASSLPPDALDVEFLKGVPNPTFTIIPGQLEQDVEYNSEEAYAAAASDVVENPLTVPALASSSDPAASGPTGTPTRRDLVAEDLARRAACGPEATVSDSYGIDVSSHAAFTADPKIASIANAAPTPAGYFQNFKNAAGASSANAYLGYSVLKTGYDVAACAAKCTAKAGCVAFNVFFERAPTLSPASACPNPPGFAAIKCSLWGVPLDLTTATNKGQNRAQFRVGIAGSNAYTSFTVGGPIEGYNPPLRLGQAALNAPLRDCAGTWSYLGYKLYENQPFDPRLCATACEAVTAFNAAHPDAVRDATSGVVPQCGAFGTYIVKRKTTTNQTFVTGQICAFYTQGWSSEYAANTGRTDDEGTKYTFEYSYFYSNPTGQPTCSASGRRSTPLIRGATWRE